MNGSEDEGAEGTACNVKDVPGAVATAHDGGSGAETTYNIENELRDILGPSLEEPYQDSGSEYVQDHRSRSSSPNLQHILEDLSIEEDQSSVSTKTTRKRIRKENTWKKNVRKNKRAKGEKYTNTKGVLVLAKTINTQYRCPCKEKCHEKIDPERQRVLFSKFYGLSNFNLQSSYLCSLVNVVIKARSCKQNA
ncbi:uncharacterized protein [Diabrotica undecimpunctata]|uniref:uncharacterized protein n=1 Tax=Diabrotica undecimpunctata TaxID=50387 RepID=UPI003B63621D